MAYNDDDIAKLKEVLKGGGYKPQLLNTYKDLYLKFLGKTFRGCNCHASNMLHELRQYALKNKLI